MFTDLPDEVAAKIFSYVGNKELLLLRNVSNQSKNVADYVLRTRKKELEFDEECNLEKCYALFKIYPDIESLILVNIPKDNMEQLLNLVAEKLTRVTSIELSDEELSNSEIELIGDKFPQIKKLTLNCFDEPAVTDDDLSDLFRKLSNLEAICLDIPRISGACFKNIAINVTFIEWCVCTDAEIESNLSFGDCGSQIQKFTFSCPYNNRNADTVIGVMKNEMTQLRELDLHVNTFSFGAIESFNLESFFLKCEVCDDFSLTRPMKTMKQFCLNSPDVNDIDLVTALRNFPNLEDLTIKFLSSDEKKFTSNVVVSLSDLKFLKKFYFRDQEYNANNYLILDDGNRNALIEAVAAMRAVSKFKIELSDLNDMNEVTAFIASFENITQERRNCEIEFIYKLDVFDTHRNFERTVTVTKFVKDGQSR